MDTEYDPMYEQEILQGVSILARKETTRTACGHIRKETKNMEARSAIENISVKSVGNRQQRK